MNNRLVIAAGALTALAVAIALITARGGEDTPVPPPPNLSTPLKATQAEPNTSRPAPYLVASRWKPGSVWIYDVTFRQSLSIVVEGQGHAATDLALSGQWTIAVTDVTPDKVLLQLRADLDPIQTNAYPEAHRTRIRDQLAVPSYLAVNTAGALQAVYVDRGMDSTTQVMLTGLAALFLHADPDTPTSTTWERKEMDNTGTYRAKYVLKEKSLTRTKAGYIKPAELKVKHTTHFTVADDGWPIEVHATETQDHQGQAPHAQTEARATWLQTATRRDPALVGAFQRDAMTLRIATISQRPDLSSVTQPFQRALDEQYAENATVDGLLTDFVVAPKGADGFKERNKALSRLQALLRVNPELISTLTPKYLKELPLNQATLLMSALSGAHTTQAHTQLTSILVALPADQDAKLRRNAVMTLGLSEPSSPEALQTLQNISTNTKDPHQGPAQLALGSQARTMAGQDPEASERARDVLWTALQTASTPEQKATLLTALGNTGDARLYPLVTRLLKEERDDRVRASAVFSLRLVKVEGVDLLLSRVITTERSGNVRLRAVAAAGHRDIGQFIQALGAAAMADGAQEIRRRAIGLLGQATMFAERIIPLLEHISQNDVVPALRADASRYVEQLRASLGTQP